MNSHCGYIESCHNPMKDVVYFKECKDGDGNQKYTDNFCDALKSGNFIPCGNSAGITWQFNSWGDSNCQKSLCPKGSATCCFLFGVACDDKVLWRRWSCCGICHFGTIKDMKDLPCTK